MTDSVHTEDLTSVPSELMPLLAQLGGVLLSVETVQTTVDLVTRLAATTLEGTVGAGVTLVDERGHRTTAASDPVVAEADALQYSLDAGPCLTAWREQIPVRVHDLTTERRWPQWSREASQLGLRSMMSIPLVADATAVSLGAIKVYSRQPDAYDVRAEDVLGLFADQAAILLANMLALADARELSAQMVDALENRDVIGQAKGVLMARGLATEQTALAMLVAASQRSKIKLHVLARRLVDSISNETIPPPVR